MFHQAPQRLNQSGGVNGLYIQCMFYIPTLAMFGGQFLTPKMWYPLKGGAGPPKKSFTGQTLDPATHTSPPSGHKLLTCVLRHAKHETASGFPSAGLQAIKPTVRSCYVERVAMEMAPVRPWKSTRNLTAHIALKSDQFINQSIHGS